MGSDASAGVKVSAITESNEPFKRVHNPNHPSADAQGYVNYSNVNPVEEMVNMISASRSPKQHRSHEHGQIAAAQDIADGSITESTFIPEEPSCSPPRKSPP